MRLVLMSDTHGYHSRVKVPPGDVLIHAGDFSAYGTEEELVRFVQWLSNLSHACKFIVPGNHDKQLEKDPRLFDLFGGVAECLFNDETTYKGYTFWGSSFQPWFNNWSFNLPRNGEELRKNWAAMPDDCDILLTHSPPHGILDRSDEGIHCGCELLRERIEVVKPRLSVFGHIHEARGFNDHTIEGVTCVNATLLDGAYRLVHNPVVLDVTDKGIEVISS